MLPIVEFEVRTETILQICKKQQILQWNGTESLTSTMAPIFDSFDLYCLYNVTTYYEIGEETENPYQHSLPKRGFFEIDWLSFGDLV